MKLWIAVVSFKAQILKYYAKSQKIWKNIQKGQKNVKKSGKLWVCGFTTGALIHLVFRSHKHHGHTGDAADFNSPAARSCGKAVALPLQPS